MTETLVRAELTPLTAESVCAAVKGAWRKKIGTEPARASTLVLMAQIWFETANGAASYGYNLGGIKHVAGDGHDYYQVRTHENQPDGTQYTIVAAFRSYPSLEAAAWDYICLLRGPMGFCWPAVEAGDVADFARRLRARGYYTAPEAQYAAGLQARYAMLDQELLEDTEPGTPIAIRQSERPVPVAHLQPSPFADGEDGPDDPGPPKDAA
jgi:hypothetical protein